MTEASYQKGDYAVYGNTGVCLVEEVGNLSFGRGEPEKCYYTLRPLADKNSVIFVPFDNELLLSKMRPVCTDKQIESILCSHLDSPIEWNNDRKTRNAVFRDILNGTDLSALLALIRCLYCQMQTLGESGRRLSASDNDILQNAKRIIGAEFSFVLGITPEDVHDYIKTRLGKDAVI